MVVVYIAAVVLARAYDEHDLKGRHIHCMAKTERDTKSDVSKSLE